MQTNTKKWLAWLSTFALAITMLGTWAPQADARMVFSTEEGSTNADSYTIDYDDSAGTGEVILRFGSTANKTISYDNAVGAEYFKINDNVSFEGHEALNFVLENSNGEVATCEMALWGRLYYDTSDKGTYICTADGWVDLSTMNGLTWDDFLSSNSSDNYSGTGTMAFDAGTTLDVNGTFDADDATVNMNGISNETFTLDEGGTGNNDVILQFGVDAGAKITWNDAESRFDFNDDVYVNGDLEISGTFTGDLADNTVETTDIENHAITTAKINTGAVTTDQIADGTITTDDIENGTITSADIHNGTITADDIFGNTITANEIASEAIGASELANNAVDTSAVQDYAITTAKINTGAVTTDQIADGAITSEKIGTGAITVNNIADNSITGAKIATGSVAFDRLGTRNKSTLISPEYPNFTLYGDTSNNLGTLDSDRDVVNQKNYYSWSSRKTVLNDYDILVQYQIPEDFDSWQANAISVNYRTEEAGTADNNIQVYLLDTAGVSTYTGSTLASASWATSNITSTNLSGGTFNAGKYITVGIKLSSRRNDGSGSGDPRSAYVGELKFNYVGQ